MSMGQESVRRRAPRLAIQVGGRLTGRSPREVTVIDLSVTGCLVRSDVAAEPGAIFDLELGLPEKPMVAKVRVADSSLDGTAGPGLAPWLVGLQFLSLPAHEHERLRRFLDEERRRRRSADPASH